MSSVIQWTPIPFQISPDMIRSASSRSSSFGDVLTDLGKLGLQYADRGTNILENAKRVNDLYDQQYKDQVAIRTGAWINQHQPEMQSLMALAQSGNVGDLTKAQEAIYKMGLPPEVAGGLDKVVRNAYDIGLKALNDQSTRNRNDAAANLDSIRTQYIPKEFGLAERRVANESRRLDQDQDYRQKQLALQEEDRRLREREFEVKQRLQRDKLHESDENEAVRNMSNYLIQNDKHGENLQTFFMENNGNVTPQQLREWYKAINPDWNNASDAVLGKVTEAVLTSRRNPGSSATYTALDTTSKANVERYNTQAGLASPLPTSLSNNSSWDPVQATKAAFSGASSGKSNERNVTVISSRLESIVDHLLKDNDVKKALGIKSSTDITHTTRKLVFEALQRNIEDGSRSTLRKWISSDNDITIANNAINYNREGVLSSIRDLNNTYRAYTVPNELLHGPQGLFSEGTRKRIMSSIAKEMGYSSRPPEEIIKSNLEKHFVDWYKNSGRSFNPEQVKEIQNQFYSLYSNNPRPYSPVLNLRPPQSTAVIDNYTKPGFTWTPNNILEGMRDESQARAAYAKNKQLEQESPDNAALAAQNQQDEQRIKNLSETISIALKNRLNNTYGDSQLFNNLLTQYLDGTLPKEYVQWFEGYITDTFTNYRGVFSNREDYAKRIQRHGEPTNTQDIDAIIAYRDNFYNRYNQIMDNIERLEIIEQRGNLTPQLREELNTLREQYATMKRLEGRASSRPFGTRVRFHDQNLKERIQRAKSK